VADDVSHCAGTDEPLELEVDVVVVGSGPGGAASASTLARAGLSVAIVEAGAWREPADYPSSAFGAMRDLFDDWGSTITVGRAFWPVVQARGVGGTTLINSAICVRTPADVFARWEREVGISGLEASVWRHQDDLERELSVEEAPPSALGINERVAIAGANALGMEGHVMRRYVKGCLGAGRCMQGCTALRKQSLNLNLVPEVLARGGHVLSNAPVRRIRFEGARAVGVEGSFVHPQTHARRGSFVVRARKAVVVAASATHSPVLLRRSGVRGSVGAGFRAHPGAAVLGEYADATGMHQGTTQGWASMQFRDDPGFKLETLSIPPEMLMSRISGGGAAWVEKMVQYPHLAMIVQATRAESVGSVWSGPGGKPMVWYSLDSADMARFRGGLAMVARIHFAAGAKAVYPGIYGLPARLGPDEVGIIEQATLSPRAYFGILSHLFGGCTMGTDPARSVVDASGRVHGREGLIVADASVIPSNLGVNPQHTIMGLARTFAEGIVARA
jgi:choline dehydrogenase-like flavoprotein